MAIPPLKVLFYKPGEIKPIAEGKFDRASVLACALMKEAPFEKGFDMRVVIELDGIEYGEDMKFAPLADRVLPAGWSKSEECVVIASEVFNKAKETVKRFKEGIANDPE